MDARLGVLGSGLEDGELREEEKVEEENRHFDATFPMPAWLMKKVLNKQKQRY